MKKLTLTLAGLAMIGPFSTDTYFPSFPAIAEHFSVGMPEMQQTLSFYLLALAIMSLFHGALSDSFGRRKVILATVAIYSIASFGSIFSPNFEWLIFFRVLQGLTAGAGFITGQAIARDLYKGHEAQKLMAKIMMLFSIAPAVAPILGGYLHIWFGWQGVFFFMTLVGVFLLALAYYQIPETLPKEERQEFHPVNLSSNYMAILKNQQFRLLALAGGLSFGAFSIYISAAPEFVLNILHLKPTQFGWLFIPIVVGIMTGSFLSHRLAGKANPQKIILVAYSLMFVSALVNVIYNIFFDASVPWAVLPLTFYMIGSATVGPVIALKALDNFPYNRGLAASIMSFVTLMLFAATSGLVAPYVIGSALKMSLIMFGLFLLNCSLLYLAERRTQAA